MNLKNTPQSYGFVTKALHALTALLLVNQFVTAAIASANFGGAGVMGWHKSIGTLILLVVLVRLVWRKATRLPDFAPGLYGWEISLIEFLERSLYILLFVLPISGIVMTLAGGYGLSVFGLFTVGPMDTVVVWLSKTAKLIHTVAAWLIFGAICSHVMLVLRREWYERGEYIDRMNPFR